MEWQHARSIDDDDDDDDDVSATDLRSENENGRRTQEIRYSETVGDKKRINIHSQKYATRWDREFSPGVRQKLRQGSRPDRYDEIGHGYRSRLLHRSSSRTPSPPEQHRRRPRSHSRRTIIKRHALGGSAGGGGEFLRGHSRLNHDWDDDSDLRQESGHVFKFRLKKPQLSEQAHTPVDPGVPSSTSGVKKWATLRSKKDELFQEKEFKVLRSRYKSNPSALQYSIADLEREDKHVASSDTQPLLLQWK